MSKIKNGGLDQYGAELLEQQQFGTAGVEGVNRKWTTHEFVYLLTLVYLVFASVTLTLTQWPWPNDLDVRI